MDTLTQPDDTDTDLYFRRRCAAVLRAAYAEAAVRGVTPDPLAA